MRHVRMTVLVAAAVLAAACGLVGDTTGPREPEFARVVRVVYRRNPGIYGWSEICLHLNGQLDEDDVRDPKRVSLGGLGFSPGEDLGNPYVASADRAIGWRTFIWDRKFEPGGVLATELAVGVEHEVWVADDCLGCGGEIARTITIEVEPGFRVEKVRLKSGTYPDAPECVREALVFRIVRD